MGAIVPIVPIVLDGANGTKDTNGKRPMPPSLPDLDALPGCPTIGSIGVLGQIKSWVFGFIQVAWKMRAELNPMLRLAMVAQRCFAQGLNHSDCLLQVAQTRGGSQLDSASRHDVIGVGEGLFNRCRQTPLLEA